MSKVSIGRGLARLGAQASMLDAQRAGAELFGAPKLNAFSLFRPNENTLSRVLGDLLSPRGAHGQGTIFLQALLNELGLPGVGMHEVVTVRREVVTSAQRRIDLVIDTPRLLIGIENKPWAVQQDDQLIDYHRQLEEWAGQRRPVLVFLSNQSPRTGQGQVLTLPYLADDETSPSLRRALEGARAHTKALRARIHVDEFIRFIDLQFEDEGMTDELDQPYIDAVKSELVGDVPTRKAIAMVMLAHDEVHARILDELGTFLEAEMTRALGACARVGCTLSEALSEAYELWAFRRENWPPNCAVGLEGYGEFSGVNFGVRAPDPQAKGVRSEGEAGCPDRALIDRAMRRVGGGRKTQWWPWWQSAEPAYWGKEFTARLILGSPTGKVADHPDAQDLARRLIELAEAIDEELRESAALTAKGNLASRG